MWPKVSVSLIKKNKHYFVFTGKISCKLKLLKDIFPFTCYHCLGTGMQNCDGASPTISPAGRGQLVKNAYYS